MSELLAPEEDRLGLGRGKLSGVFDIAENVVSIFALGAISETTARRLARNEELRSTEAPPDAPTPIVTWCPATAAETQMLGTLKNPKDVPLEFVLRRLNEDQWVKLALFRLLWNLQLGVKSESSAAAAEPIRLVCTYEEANGGTIALEAKGGSFDEASSRELISRLAMDTMLRALLSVLLKPRRLASGTVMNLALRAKLPWAEGGRRLDYEFCVAYIGTADTVPALRRQMTLS